MARCVCDGSLPAFQAMTASTANSGRVCSQARMAKARPCEMRNCAASAPQAMTNAEKRMLGKVQSADHADVFSIIGLAAKRDIVDEEHRQPAQPLVQTRARGDPRPRGRDRAGRAEDGGG